VIFDNRSQRNHIFLLPLHAVNVLLAHSRLRSHSPWQWRISILYRGAKWAHFSAMCMFAYQRIRGIPVIRRWHHVISLAPSNSQLCYVYHHGLGFVGNFQIMGRPWPNTHCWDVHRALPCFWNRNIGIRCYANHPCGKHAPGSLAIRRHCFWSTLFNYWPSHPVRFQQHNMQRCATLLGWIVLCDHLQPLGCDDGLQGSCPVSSHFLTTDSNINPVLGFHHPRRSRIFRRHQAKQLGSERAAS